VTHSYRSIGENSKRRNTLFLFYCDSLAADFSETFNRESSLRPGEQVYTYCKSGATTIGCFGRFGAKFRVLDNSVDVKFCFASIFSALPLELSLGSISYDSAHGICGRLQAEWAETDSVRPLADEREVLVRWGREPVLPCFG
jgi:hypothetical protein